MDRGRIPAAVADVPGWLEPMLTAKFFYGCSRHTEGSRHTECNMFCLDCRDAAGGFCVFCRVARHEDHPVLQIRRSSYHNVVRVSETEKLLDLSGVQTYVINSARVVFLNDRPQSSKSGSSSSGGSSSSRSVGHLCEICGRGLLEAFRFCSLGCKLARIKRVGDASFKTENNGVGEAAAERVQAVPAPVAGNGTMYDSPPPSPAPTSPPRPPQRSSASQRRRPRKGIPMRAPFSS